ncbi:TetR family transcriptional regulator [Erysipelotrichaceae bacterium]|nr:TetR family transcriptional regulator [Erysipelotrichaceae bacterium]
MTTKNNNLLSTKEIKIIEVAAKEFLENGYTVASTNIIARDAGVAKGLIFHYFGNKQALYLRTLAYAFEKTKILIEQKTLALSTYMDTFDLISDLITIKAQLPFFDTISPPLLLQAFETKLELSPQIMNAIQELEVLYEKHFYSYLENMQYYPNMKKIYYNDPEIIIKIFIMLSSAHDYEKQKLIPLSLTGLSTIQLGPYINIVKAGIFT